MSGPWPAGVQVVHLGFQIRAQLGKMLQPQPSGPGDNETEYLKAGTLPLADVSHLPSMYASTQDLRRYEVKEGDLVVAEGGDVGKTAFVPPLSTRTIIQNSLHRLRSNGGTDMRFIRYCLDSIYANGWLEVLCNKATFGHLTGEKLAALPIPLTDVQRQRAIADYLDAETVRIDALIERRQRMVDLLEEKSGLVLVSALAGYGFTFPSSLAPDWRSRPIPTGWRVIHLNVLLLQLTNGYVGPTRDILVDEGIRYVQSLHIKGGSIDFSRGPFYVEEQWHRERPRIHLRPGDVLIVQTGDIGQVAVVPHGFGPASCHALQIARVRSEVISGLYLGEYLRSPFGYQSLLSRATGALHPHLEGGIRDVPVVVPPRSVQDALVAEAAAGRAALDDVARRLSCQIDLLIERRQALITAAVTGELEIPEVAA